MKGLTEKEIDSIKSNNRFSYRIFEFFASCSLLLIIGWLIITQSFNLLIDENFEMDSAYIFVDRLANSLASLMMLVSLGYYFYWFRNKIKLDKFLKTHNN